MYFYTYFYSFLLFVFIFLIFFIVKRHEKVVDLALYKYYYYVACVYAYLTSENPPLPWGQFKTLTPPSGPPFWLGDISLSQWDGKGPPAVSLSNLWEMAWTQLTCKQVNIKM